ncbi:hypothetical protein RD1_3686 [Roseobacter denitrificans OCh 114]|uniref:Uncharacterized protein n=1 Tax=Roseobacter denitrificans (strain ATCC 33942 / OCh 114) TaxID=375451 RepID=Q162D4_ROSDO|nr:hypothetical protein RD1_3686 [Roseobacter denitrificans OCh 114]
MHHVFAAPSFDQRQEAMCNAQVGAAQDGKHQMRQSGR